jgi:hypothetical protein
MYRPDAATAQKKPRSDDQGEVEDRSAANVAATLALGYGAAATPSRQIVDGGAAAHGSPPAMPPHQAHREIRAASWDLARMDTIGPRKGH